MSRKPPTTDGFIPRRSIGSADTPESDNGLRSSFDDSGLTHASDERGTKGSALKREQHSGLSRREIDATLQGIDSEDQHASKTRKKSIGRKRLIKRILLGFLAVFILGLIVIGIKFLLASGNIFKGNILGLVQSKELKMDANGRSNIVVFGTSEDDEGGNHPGAYLTDSILIVSIDQKQKNAYSYSIPRDLWVKYGAACNSGYEGRINEVFSCFSESGKNEAAGADALRKSLTTVTGMDIQYYAHLNYSVVRDAVNAVGGVGIKIESKDPRGILDRNFDWKCQYKCNYVKYANGPTGNMDGEHALALARARGSASPTYGLERGNFDREINQQKIMKALQQKALSAGTLANIGKVTNLLDAFGKNLRTNFESAEIRTLMNLARDIPADKVQSISLADAEPAVFVNDNVGGASIVRPVAGFYDYSGIQRYLKRQLTSDPAVREQAAIGIYNGTTTTGLAQKVADELSKKGMNVSDVGNAPAGKYGSYEIYDLTKNNAKPNTSAKLKALYGVDVKNTPPPLATTGLDFVIIVGKAAQSS